MDASSRCRVVGWLIGGLKSPSTSTNQSTEDSCTAASKQESRKNLFKYACPRPSPSPSLNKEHAHPYIRAYTRLPPVSCRGPQSITPASQLAKQPLHIITASALIVHTGMHTAYISACRWLRATPSAPSDQFRPEQAKSDQNRPQGTQPNVPCTCRDHMCGTIRCRYSPPPPLRRLLLYCH